MKKRITAWLLSAAMLLGMLPLAQARGTIENSHTVQPGSMVDKIKVDIDEDGKQPWLVNMTITPAAGATSGTQYYAVLLRTDVYGKAPVASDPTQIKPTNYSSLAYTGDDKKFYRFGATATIIGPADTAHITFPKLTSFEIGANGTMGFTNTDSFQEYTYVVFSNRGAEQLTDYAVGAFVVGADGYLKSPSYILHYNTNGSANGSSQGTSTKPASKIVKLDANGNTYEGSTQLEANKPTRTGYTFHGWDAKQTHWESFLLSPAPTGMGEDRYKPVAECASRYQAGATVSYADLLAAHNAANNANVQPNEAGLYGAYTLYAQWRPIQVGIEKDAQEAALTAKVGVPFTYTPVITGAVDNTKEGKKTVKAVTIVASSYDEANPGDTLIEGRGTLPPGLNLDTQTGVISGTPQKSWDKTIKLRLHVEDKSNKTTDEVEIVLPKIEKADQYLPELDKNVGLETRVTDTDGQIFGFYAPGNTSSTSDGTGSSAKTYLDLADGKEANIFEYLPLTDPEGKDYELTEWREIPLPESYYADLPETAEDADTVTKADLAAAMAAGATLDLSTRMTENEGVQTAKTAREAGWGAPYGSIVYEELSQKDGSTDKFPVLHGLPKGAVYAVRFKANNGYTASPELRLTITAGGGGAVSGDSGYSVIFNLAGGDFPTEGEGEDAVQKKFELVHGGLKTGDKVEIPAIEPVREGYSFEGWTDGKNIYRYDAEAETKVSVEVQTSNITLAAKWVSTTDGFVSITFYDWDETTILGSIVVPKGADATDEVNKFVLSQMSDDSRDKAILAGADDEDKPYFVDDDSHPLTYKRGYSFYGWLPNNSVLSTHCGRAVSGMNKLYNIPEPQEQELQSFKGISHDLIVKTCYKDNSELYYPTSDSDLQQLKNASYSAMIQEYNRLGSSSVYVLGIHIKREHLIDGKIYGVPRLIEPTLKVSYGENINFYSIDTADDLVYKIYPGGSTATVGVMLVDFYNVPVKTNAADKANAVDDSYGTSATDQNGFRWKGTIGMINDQLESGELSLLTFAILRTQAGLSNVTPANYVTARQSMRTAWLSVNSVDGDGVEMKPESEWRDLSYNEMLEAINTGGILT